MTLSSHDPAYPIDQGRATNRLSSVHYMDTSHRWYCADRTIKSVQSITMGFSHSFMSNKTQNHWFFLINQVFNCLLPVVFVCDGSPPVGIISMCIHLGPATQALLILSHEVMCSYVRSSELFGFTPSCILFCPTNPRSIDYHSWIRTNQLQ